MYSFRVIIPVTLTLRESNVIYASVNNRYCEDIVQSLWHVVLHGYESIGFIVAGHCLDLQQCKQQCCAVEESVAIGEGI